MAPLDDDSPEAGWASSFPDFVTSPRGEVLERLKRFVLNPGEPQIRAWRQSIPMLQREAGELLSAAPPAANYSAILEHQLPLDSRRSDAVFLVSGGVVVIELKGKIDATLADLDQASAYARDLRAYHRECRGRAVHAVLVPTRYSGTTHIRDGVWVASPESLDVLVRELAPDLAAQITSREEFLHRDAYSPLPTLVQAARELFFSGTLREVWKAKAATEPAVNRIAEVTHQAARDHTRHLILVSGVPGSGKTLVGMRAVHAHYLDDLSVPRASGKPPAPALYLSGNQPLVELLQHIFKGAGDGKVFVRHMKKYLDSYFNVPSRIPPEHLLVFDEAQRAFSADKVAEIHKDWPQHRIKSEPALFVELAERIPQWSVIVGLIGSGQEIYSGEEGGIVQWCDAILSSPNKDAWLVHAPAELEAAFGGSGITTSWEPVLQLNTELRYHSASGWHDLVENMLAVEAEAAVVREHDVASYGLAGFHVRLTRDLEAAKAYLRDRYERNDAARYGLLASSRDSLLESFGVRNGHGSMRFFRVGPWFADGPSSELSCCQLSTCATEFKAQGLELDMALVAWGSDFVRRSGRWTSEGERSYRKSALVRDKHRLRMNSYRVLLTRGRDGNVIFVPPDSRLDETWSFLRDVGFQELG